jgi:hypothetical protein
MCFVDVVDSTLDVVYALYVGFGSQLLTELDRWTRRSWWLIGVQDVVPT